MHPGMIKGAMNRTTNLFVLLILISFILPATAIRYAQAATEISQDSDSTGNEQQQNSTGSGQESGSSSTENSQQSNNAGNAQEMPGATSSSGSTSNATSTGVPGYCPPTCAPRPAEPSPNTNTNSTPTVVPENAPSPTGNNTGIAQADLANIILTVHNRERAAFGVAPLVWSDKLAADAKTWADHIAETGQIVHCQYTPGCDTHGEGENIANGGSPRATDVGALAAYLQDGWVSEKSDYHGVGPPTSFTQEYGHYTEMVTPKAKEVGCATAADGHILVCRYSLP
jgi:uncharacterized protein YkwD